MKRNGFCLGCGKDVGPVEVPSDGYHTVPREVPSWCREECCQTAGENFRKTTEAIDRFVAQRKAEERAARFGWPRP